jgi:hypothetical protein
VNRIFAIAGLEPAHAPDNPSQAGTLPMSKLLHTKAASLRFSPSYWLCVVLSAYVSLQLVAPGILVAHGS